MRAGRLRTKVDIQQKISVPDGLGGNVSAWETVASVWGRRVIKSGYQKTVAEQIESRLDAEWEIRYMSGISPDMRLEAEGKIYDIKAVYDPSQKKALLRLLTTEYQAEGS